MKHSTKISVFWFLLPLLVGGVVAFLTRNSTEIYQTVVQPMLSPPPILFPIVWSILYVLMGICAVLVYRAGCVNALIVFSLQLVLNFLWPLLFFNAQAFWAAFLLIVLLWGCILWMTTLFFQCRPLAGWLSIPYLLWVTFAAYLNVMIAWLN